MGSVAGQWRFTCALISLFFVTFIHGLKAITAQLGQNLTLTCRGEGNVTGLLLTRADLDPQYVFVFRDNRPDLTRQNKLFRDRVVLPVPLVTNDDGDVVLYLSNVSWSDNGTYSCHVHKRGGGPVKTSFDVRVMEPDGGTTPTEDPPTEDPPTEDPPTEDPPTKKTPVEEPPSSEDTFIIMFILIPMYAYGLVVACLASYNLINDHLKNE